MIYRYSHFDAGCSLFVRRPWDYLHAMPGISPAVDKSTLSREVYRHAPFPYRDLSLAIGLEPRNGNLAAAPAPGPRAFLVYAAEVVGDYGVILKRLARGHDIHRSALLESPLAEPLPLQSALPGAAAAISAVLSRTSC